MKQGLTAAQFQKKILDWYYDHKRELPWRSTQNPYFIWVSEIILQQTRVAQGLPYYLRFIDAFPTVDALAAAKEDQVLRLWQGLGYYSRARNMHRCAKKIVSEYHSLFPNTYQQLLALPGIGPYTAAAISSIAFNEKAAVVDGNVFRVLSRVYGIDSDIASNAGKTLFAQKANELIDAKRPGDFNQAMMEFGATHCLPQNPNCAGCPFAKACVALATGRVSSLPVKSRNVKARIRHFTYFVVTHNNKVAMRQRTGRDIWKGLFEFYLVETKQITSPEKILSADPVLKKLKCTTGHTVSVTHVLTHQKLQIQFVELLVKAVPKLGDEFALYSARKIKLLAKPIVISRFLEKREF